MSHYENFSKKLGLFSAVNLMIGSLLGAAIYIILPDIVGGVGKGMFLSFILGAIPAIFGGIYYIQLNATFPHSGGTYYFSKRLLGTYGGFTASLCLIFGLLGALAMLANGFAQYFNFYFSNIPITIPLIGILILFFLINVAGLRTVSVLQNIMVMLILSALIILVAPGLWQYFNGHEMTVSNDFLPGGGKALFSASVAAFMSYGTFVFLTSLGGKIQNSKRNTPLAMVIGISTVTILFSIVGFTATAVAPVELISQSSAALPDIGALYLPPILVTFIGISGLFAISTTLNTTFAVISSELQTLGEDGLLPKFFGKTHHKYKTPINSLAFSCFLSIILLLAELSQTIFIHIVICGILLSVFITGIAALRLRTKLPEEFNKAEFHFPKWLLYPSIIIGGLLSLSYSIYVLFAFPIITFLFAIFLAIMNGFYYYLQVARRPKSADEYRH